jgi:SNF family Na+-dependent transporter
MSPERDTDPADDLRDLRDETPPERADRNWTEVLQELRVMQTGTQILTGFLLALAFQPAFSDLTSPQRAMYLALVVLSALSSIVALAPVSLHRILFRQGAKREVVSYGHAALITALVTVSVLLVGVVGFVFDVVVDSQAAIVSVIALSVVIIALWVAAPLAIRSRLPRSGR